MNKFIIVDDYNSYKSLEVEPWFKTNINQNNGIWIGNANQTQFAIKMPNITTQDRKINFSEIAFKTLSPCCCFRYLEFIFIH